MIKNKHKSVEFSTKSDPHAPADGGAGIGVRDPHQLYNKKSDWHCYNGKKTQKVEVPSIIKLLEKLR